MACASGPRGNFNQMSSFDAPRKLGMGFICVQAPHSMAECVGQNRTFVNNCIPLHVPVDGGLNGLLAGLRCNALNSFGVLVLVSTPSKSFPALDDSAAFQPW
jgi:hypothetical protein